MTVLKAGAELASFPTFCFFAGAGGVVGREGAAGTAISAVV
jgi:hypothetical protein